MNTPSPVIVIAVVGGSGAGKGWVVQRLCRLFGDRAAHLQLDNFYRDRSHLSPSRRAGLNYDIPSAIDWADAERVIRACRAGQPTAVPNYDFETHCRTGEATAWAPKPIVLVDGLWLLRPPAIRALFDLKIFLDAPTELRHARRLSRDVAERGYTAEAIEHQLRTAVAPMHDRYVEPQKKWADLVLAQPLGESEIEALAARLWPLLAASSLVQSWEQETFRTQLLDSLQDQHHEICL